MDGSKLHQHLIYEDYDQRAGLNTARVFHTRRECESAIRDKMLLDGEVYVSGGVNSPLTYQVNFGNYTAYTFCSMLTISIKE